MLKNHGKQYLLVSAVAALLFIGWYCGGLLLGFRMPLESRAE